MRPPKTSPTKPADHTHSPTSKQSWTRKGGLSQPPLCPYLGTGCGDRAWELAGPAESSGMLTPALRLLRPYILTPGDV